VNEISDAFKIATLREAAEHAPHVLPGDLGTTVAEWLIGEANCQEGGRKGTGHVKDMVNAIAGEPVVDEKDIYIFVSTLDAAFDFAQAVLARVSGSGSGVVTQ
jgi:hypothetical protein